MPKKSATSRGGAQRNRAKTQKSFELVRPAPTTTEEPEQPSEELEKEEVAREVTPIKPTRNTSADAQPAEESAASVSPAPKGSAAEKIAARRQARQRTAYRSTASLITAEHFAYVQRDLITIGILAVLMVVIIIACYFFLEGRLF
jgi:cobalamin biosynthesis Mg chelatase CobN